MKINRDRLSAMLFPLGYVVSRTTRHSFSFVRKSSRDGLFLKLLVEFQGRKHEAVYGRAGISYTQWIPLEGDTVRTLIELATDRERRWAIIETTDQAKSWERRFVDLAPAAAEAYAREHGDELLQRTAHARQKAFEILRFLDPAKSLYQSIQEFRATYGSDFIKEAERLAEWPAVMQVYDADEVYLLACCGVLSSDEGKAFVGQDPLKNDELMRQIQLVSDGILSWSKLQDVARK